MPCTAASSGLVFGLVLVFGSALECVKDTGTTITVVSALVLVLVLGLVLVLVLMLVLGLRLGLGLVLAASLAETGPRSQTYSAGG